jgi:hypothetical protein
VSVSQAMRHAGGEGMDGPSPHKLRGIARHIAVIASTSNVPKPTITPAKPNMRASYQPPAGMCPIDFWIARARLRILLSPCPHPRRPSPNRPTGGLERQVVR